MAMRTAGILTLASLSSSVLAVNNGLARTPQMGWNNWNALGCDVSESLLLDTARQLVNTGLRDVGYKYVLLDDCWSAGRDRDGLLRPDPSKFLNGMRAVSDKIHDLGLLFGMYSSAGELTCARYEGSLDHEPQDAKAFAGWGVDYLKYDNCYHRGRFGTPQISFDRFDAMWRALNATGRPILYSLCNWGEDYPHTWGMSIANSWRVSGDIYDAFSRPDDLCSCGTASSPHCVAPGSRCSVLHIVNKVAPYVDRGQPGGWNDLDMLEVGNGGMSDDEYKSHISLWAALKSPLIIGTDLRAVSARTLTLLNNPALIAISQDPLGRPAVRVRRDVIGVTKDRYGVGEIHVWSGPLKGGDQVVLLLNAGDEDCEVEAGLDEIFVGEGPGGSAWQVRVGWEVWDVWAGRMAEDAAERILQRGLKERREVFRELNWYNATEVSYEVGLETGDERLMGALVGRVEAEGSLRANVKRHGVGVFRLKFLQKEGWRKKLSKEEL